MPSSLRSDKYAILVWAHWEQVREAKIQLMLEKSASSTHIRGNIFFSLFYKTANLSDRTIAFGASPYVEEIQVSWLLNKENHLKNK
jgi:hypothetical protein